MHKKYHIGILATHPIQYYIPWYRAMSVHPDISLKVFYCYRQTTAGQAQGGFGVPFEWDIPMFEGYEYKFLDNRSHKPGVYNFFGCDTPEIKAIIHKEKFNAFIVHGWNCYSFWQAMAACWSSGTPLFIRGDSQLLMQRSLIKRAFKYPLYRLFIPRFNAYLIVGSRAREYYLHYGADASRMFFAPHSVDNNYFISKRESFVRQRDAIRRSWGVPDGSMVFLFAGKLVPKKRPFDFLTALKNACGRSRNKLFGLVVGDGPLRGQMEKMASDKNLPVAFTGFLNQSEVPKAYVASDVLVLPSNGRETWGLVVNEAMACCLPAIVSEDAGCSPDLIRSGETGEVFPCGDVERLSKVMTDFADGRKNPKEMGAKARMMVEKYSVDNAVTGTFDALRACGRKVI